MIVPHVCVGSSPARLLPELDQTKYTSDCGNGELIVEAVRVPVSCSTRFLQNALASRSCRYCCASKQFNTSHVNDYPISPSGAHAGSSKLVIIVSRMAVSPCFPSMPSLSAANGLGKKKVASRGGRLSPPTQTCSFPKLPCLHSPSLHTHYFNPNCTHVYLYLSRVTFFCFLSKFLFHFWQSRQLCLPTTMGMIARTTCRAYCTITTAATMADSLNQCLC